MEAARVTVPGPRAPVTDPPGPRARATETLRRAPRAAGPISPLASPLVRVRTGGRRPPGRARIRARARFLAGTRIRARRPVSPGPPDPTVALDRISPGPPDRPISPGPPVARDPTGRTGRPRRPGPTVARGPISPGPAGLPAKPVPLVHLLPPGPPGLPGPQVPLPPPVAPGPLPPPPPCRTPPAR